MTVGGYVSRPGEGEAGRSFQAGDRSDFYRVSLLAGQSVTMDLGGTAVSGETDLDLFVYNADGDVDLNNPDFASVGANSLESVTVPVQGDYFVEVFATAGAANYTLFIGQAVPLTGASLRMDQEFLPGEALVEFAAVPPANGASDAVSIAAARTANSAGATRPQRIDITRMMQDRRGSRSPASLATALHERLDALYRDNPVQRARWETLHAVKLLRKRAYVRYAEPNYLRKPMIVPDDSFYGLQWHYPLVNLPQAWDITTGDPGIIVFVIDTGVVLGHPDLQGQLVAGYDFISDAANALDGDGIDADPDDPGDRANPDGSSSFHGTHVAGIIAAATDNRIGVAGVAWNARLMPLRVSGASGGSDYDIAQAIRFSAGLANDANRVPPVSAAVINISLGAGTFSTTLCNAVSAARAAGAIVVAAAGNESSRSPVYPAACDGSISVSAVDISKQLASYSNFGDRIDLAAPGGDSGTDVNGDSYPDFVLSSVVNDTSGNLETVYSFQAGTSMAAPHVAGVIALMEAAALADGDNITPDEFDSLLASGALTEDPGAPGRDDLYGYGLINAARAVLAVPGDTASNAVPSSTPASLNFGTATAAADVLISNAGGGSISVNAVTVTPVSAGNWLTVTAQDVDSGGLGTYSARVNRSAVPEGSYTATIAFTTTGGTLEVPVLMQHVTGTPSDYAGFHYVAVIDPDTGTSVASAAATVNNSRYEYRVTDVPFGDYLIFAGSNFDNDAEICEPGEACGAYLSLDQPIRLRVDSDRTCIDFTTDFDLFFGETGLPVVPAGLSEITVRGSAAGQVFIREPR